MVKITEGRVMFFLDLKYQTLIIHNLFEGVLRLIKPNFNGTIWRKIPMEALYSIPFWFGVFLINLAAIFSCFMLKYSVF